MGTAVVTQGAAPTLFAYRGSGGFPEQQQLHDLPSTSVAGVRCGQVGVAAAAVAAAVGDTNGCGDAFVGGFLWTFMTCPTYQFFCTLDECVEEGHRLARLVLANQGCELPTLEGSNSK